MRRGIILAVLLCVLSGGCYFSVHHPQPVTPSQHATWFEVRHLIWAEYYGCDTETVVYLRSLEDFHDSDLFFLLWVSNWARVEIRDVVVVYRRYDCRLFSVMTHFQLSPSAIFVALPMGTQCPPAYTRAYGLYWNRHAKPGFTLNNDECRSLVYLRIGVDYYGYRPTEYFSHFENVRRTHSSNAHRHIALWQVGRLGSGGKNARGQKIDKPMERPWLKRVPLDKDDGGGGPPNRDYGSDYTRPGRAPERASPERSRPGERSRPDNSNKGGQGKSKGPKKNR